MGAFGPSRVRQLLPGSTTKTLSRTSAARLLVLMVHAAALGYH